MDIGTGITIGGGITISRGGATMRSLLSPSGQTAYDAATTGNFFAVSSTDYNNIASGLSSITKYGMNDSQLTQRTGGWTATYAQALPATVCSISTGTYIIGFVCRPDSSAGNATPLISTGFPPVASYAAIANTVSAATGGSLNYFLRKAPASAAGATSYLGLVLDVTSSNNNSLGSIQGYYSMSGPPYTTWTGWTGPFIHFQALGTPTVQW